MGERIQTSSVQRPSFEKYKNFYDEYESNIECTCSAIVTPYSAILSISPVLHPICSSDFVTDDWLWGLTFTNGANHPEDWFRKSVSQFRLFMKLCNLTKSTVNDMLNQLNLRKVITSKLMSENEFYERLNVTIDAMIQSTEIHYRVIVETLKILLQVDQPFLVADSLTSMLSINTKLTVKMLENQYHNATIPSVSHRTVILNWILFIACMLRSNWY